MYRLAEANLQGIVRDILGLYETEGRRAVAEAVSAGKLFDPCMYAICGGGVVVLGL